MDRAGFRQAGRRVMEPHSLTQKTHERPLIRNCQMDRIAEGQKKKIEDAFSSFSSHGWMVLSLSEIKQEVMQSLSSNL